MPLQNNMTPGRRNENLIILFFFFFSISLSLFICFMFFFFRVKLHFGSRRKCAGLADVCLLVVPYFCSSSEPQWRLKRVVMVVVVVGGGLSPSLVHLYSLSPGFDL